jgi:tetratricopeptide (TPR) repeat protein
MTVIFRPFATVILALCAGLLPANAGAKEGIAGAFLAARIAAANSDYRAADLWYQRALALDGQNPQLVQGAMIAALSLGDLQRAAGLADSLAKLGASDQNMRLAQLAAAAAARDYAKILALQPQGGAAGSMQDDLLAGWALIGLGQMNDGITRFDAVAKVDGLAGFGLYHKSIALALAGDYEGAVAALAAPEAKALQSSRRGSVLFAELLSQVGKPDEAANLLTQRFAGVQDARIQALIAQLSQGVALPISGFEDAGSGLAEVFFSVAAALGDESDPAYRLLQARIASVLNPQDSEALLLTASLLERLQQFDLAAETYQKIPPAHPDFIMAEVGRADAVFAGGRADESLQILRDLAENYPQEFDVQVALGHGLRRAEQFKEAIGAYDAAFALMPDLASKNWPLLYSRAIALDSIGEYDRAEADFRRALEQNPNQPDVLNYLGYSLVDRGQKLEEALGMIERAVALQPTSGPIVDSLAWALFRLGRFGEALAPMERAAELEPVDPIVTDHLGDVYWANGRKREAVFQWRRALSFEPVEKDAARIRQKLELGLDAVRAAEGDDPFPAAGAGGL